MTSRFFFVALGLVFGASAWALDAPTTDWLESVKGTHELKGTPGCEAVEIALASTATPAWPYYGITIAGQEYIIEGFSQAHTTVTAVSFHYVYRDNGSAVECLEGDRKLVVTLTRDARGALTGLKLLERQYKTCLHLSWKDLARFDCAL